MVIAEGTAIITSIKAAMEIVKGLKLSYDDNTVMNAQSEILEQLFNIRMDAITLQEKTLALSNNNQELTKKLMEFEQWEKTRSEYELQEVTRGQYAYFLKKNQQSKEPFHMLCQQCWNERKKSILHAEFYLVDEAKYVCPKCKLSIHYYTSQLLNPSVH